MRRARLTSWTVLLALPFLLQWGCGERGDAPDPAPASENVVVSGHVLEVEDLVPVDGGVTIAIKTERGETEQLLFPSLFTLPHPPRETIDLYETVKRVKVGDSIRAEGHRSENGIDLVALEVLGSGG